VKNKMKKNKFTFIHYVIIILFAASLPVYAAEVKNAPAPPKTVKAAPVAANVTAKPQPAHAANANVAGQPKSVPAAATATVPLKPQTQPTAANVPVQKQAPAPPAPDSSKDSVATTPISTSVPDYSYNPMDKPDPFKPFIEMEKIEKKKAEKKAPDSIFPLQRAEADSYRVVGIAGTPEQRVAVVEDTAKKFYTLTKGTRIGLYEGKVVEILADRVIVEEYEDKKARRVTLKLRKN